MALADNNGRAYKRFADLHVADLVETDDGFTCMKKGQVKTVKHDDGFYIECRSGRHYLIGQEDTIDHTDAVVGIYPGE